MEIQKIKLPGGIMAVKINDARIVSSSPVNDDALIYRSNTGVYSNTKIQAIYTCGVTENTSGVLTFSELNMPISDLLQHIHKGVRVVVVATKSADVPSQVQELVFENPTRLSSSKVMLSTSVGLTGTSLTGYYMMVEASGSSTVYSGAKLVCLTATEYSNMLSDHMVVGNLATVATSGSYNDLSNKPSVTTPALNVTGPTLYSSGYPTISFMGTQREYTVVGISSGVTQYAFTFNTTNKFDNYLLLDNSGNRSEVTVLFRGLQYNGTSVSVPIVPNSSIKVPAGGYLELSYIADNSFGIGIANGIGIVAVSSALAGWTSSSSS